MSTATYNTTRFNHSTHDRDISKMTKAELVQVLNDNGVVNYYTSEVKDVLVAAVCRLRDRLMESHNEQQAKVEQDRQVQLEAEQANPHISNVFAAIGMMFDRPIGQVREEVAKFVAAVQGKENSDIAYNLSYEIRWRGDRMVLCWEVINQLQDWAIKMHEQAATQLETVATVKEWMQHDLDSSLNRVLDRPSQAKHTAEALKCRMLQHALKCIDGAIATGNLNQFDRWFHI